MNSAGSLWAAPYLLEDPAGQGGRLLTYVWAGVGSAGQPPSV